MTSIFSNTRATVHNASKILGNSVAILAVCHLQCAACIGRVERDDGAHCAIGIHGQWIYIDPTSEVVIIKLSSQPLPLDDKVDHLLLTAFDAIARKLG